MNERATILTVDDLVSVSSFGLSSLAGGDGLTREVLWAHSCELRSPEQWLGPHELLMTVGHCVPHDDEGQKDLIAHLDRAGLAGIVIGDHETAPEVSDAMKTEADTRGFPLLLAASRIPFAVIARHVAAASSSDRVQQVLTLSKVYQIATSAADGATLVEELATLLNVGLSVVDCLTGLDVLTSRGAADSTVSRRERRFPLSGDHRAELLVREHPNEPIDGFLLIHLRKVLETAADRVTVTADHRTELSERAYRDLRSVTDPSEVTPLLQGHTPDRGYRILAFPETERRKIGRAAAVLDLPVLLGSEELLAFMYVPVAEIDRVRSMAEDFGLPMGLHRLSRTSVTCAPQPMRHSVRWKRCVSADSCGRNSTAGRCPSSHGPNARWPPSSILCSVSSETRLLPPQSCARLCSPISATIANGRRRLSSWGYIARA